VYFKNSYMEVTLQGSWLLDNSKDAVGVFFTTMSHHTEFFLHKLWQEAETWVQCR
jgi:hypothetical protein